MPEFPIQSVAAPWAAPLPVMQPVPYPGISLPASPPAVPVRPAVVMTPVPKTSALSADLPKKDLYTDTPARYLGYSSEVTTATRTLPLFANRFRLWNPLGWVITIGYGLGHALTSAKSRQDKTLSEGKPGNTAWHEAVETFGEKLTFHTISTWVLPIVLIHAVQKITKKALQMAGKNPGFWPVAAGLGIIPVIPKIIDPLGERLTEAATDRLITPFVARI